MASCIWRLNSRYGVAYVEERRLAAEIVNLEGGGRRTDDAVMATYYSSGGRAYAWQVRFRIEHLDVVTQMLALETRNAQGRSEKTGARVSQGGEAKTRGVSPRARKSGI